MGGGVGGGEVEVGRTFRPPTKGYLLTNETSLLLIKPLAQVFLTVTNLFRSKQNSAIYFQFLNLHLKQFMIQNMT